MNLFKKLFTKKPPTFNPIELKKRQKISYLWGDKIRVGIITYNFTGSNFVFVTRTDNGKKERDEVMYYQIMEVLK